MTTKLAELRTARLTITPFCERHLTDTYVGWLNDPAVVRYSEQRHLTHTRESCRQYVQSFEGSNHSLSAIEADNLGHIGNIAVNRDPANNFAEISILVGAPDARGGGYGTEAWIAVMTHLLETEGHRKVSAGTMAENKPMLTVMETSGMAIEGRWPRYFLFEGREVDLIFASAYPGQRAIR